MNKSYTYQDAFNGSLKYFNGDELAARVWVNKYSLKDAFGNIYEKSPSEVHWDLSDVRPSRRPIKFVDLFSGVGGIRLTEYRKKPEEELSDKVELHKRIMDAMSGIESFKEYCEGYPYTLVADGDSEWLNDVREKMLDELRKVKEVCSAVKKRGCMSAVQIAVAQSHICVIKAQLEEVAATYHGDEAVSKEIGAVVDSINKAYCDAPLHLLLQAYEAILEHYCRLSSSALEYEDKVRSDVAMIQNMYASYESAHIEANKQRWETDVSPFVGSSENLRKYQEICDIQLKSNPVFKYRSTCSSDDDLLKWMYHNPRCSQHDVNSCIELQWKCACLESKLCVLDSDKCKETNFKDDKCRREAMDIVQRLRKLPKYKYGEGVIYAVALMKFKHDGLIQLRKDGSIAVRPLWDEICGLVGEKMVGYEMVNKGISAMRINQLDIYDLKNVDVDKLSSDVKVYVDAMRYVEVNLFEESGNILVSDLRSSAKC